MQLMLECKNLVSWRLPPGKKKSLNYTELGRVALGSFGKWAVNLSVLGCNLGVCAGYLIFISSNLQVSDSHCVWLSCLVCLHKVHVVDGSYVTKYMFHLLSTSWSPVPSFVAGNFIMGC